MDQPVFNRAEVYRNLLPRDDECGGSVVLRYISRLFSNYLFRVHYENSTNAVNYNTGSIACHLLFSGSYDAGHFDVLQNNSYVLKPHNVPSNFGDSN